MTPSRPDRAGARDSLPTLEPVRLARADRREVLLDAALALVAAGDVDAVSIESVADRAGVSRPLVYKHFANRGDILIALYQRESERLHKDLSIDVIAAGTVEEQYRALFRGSMRAAKERGQIFERLRAAAGMNGQLREVARERDRQTVAYYARHAVAEFGIAKVEAESITAMLLGAIAPALSLWHAHPTDGHASDLEDAYMIIVSGALDRLRAATRRPARRTQVRTRSKST